MVDASLMEEPVLLEANEHLSKALGSLQRRNDDYFFVTQDGAFAGMVDSRVLRDFWGDPAETKAKSVMVSAPVLTPDAPEQVIISKLLSSRTKALPVVDKRGKILGAVTRFKALDLLRGMPEVHGKKVRDAMSSPVFWISENATIAQARHAMKEKGVFRLVVTNERGEVTGVISAFDLSTKVQTASREKRRQYYYFPTPKVRMDDEPVKMVMSETVKTIKPNEGILEAVRQLQKTGVSSLVVVEDNKPKGMLTVRDVLSLCGEEKKPKVTLVGLTGEESFFKASLETLAAKYWEKISRRMPLQPDDELIVYVRSKNVQGGKREYEVKSRLTTQGRVMAHKPKDRPEHYRNWDLQAAVKESLEDLLKMSQHQHNPRGERPMIEE